VENGKEKREKRKEKNKSLERSSRTKGGDGLMHLENFPSVFICVHLRFHISFL
jgi:hypothetical protein